MGNAYLDKKAARDQALLDAGEITGKQQIADYITLVLRDPDYVGKDIFGRERIEKVLAGLEHYDKLYRDAYTTKKEADVWQERLDKALREVYGEDLIPFPQRQPYVKQAGYAKSKKGWVD